MTDLDRLRPLALTDPSAEAALNRELRRRDLPPEWTLHPSAAPGVCESPQRDRVEGWAWVEGWVAPLAAPGSPAQVWRAFVFDGDAEDGEVAVYLSLAPREQTLCFASVDGRDEPSLRVYRGPGAQWAIDSDPRLYAALTHCPASLMVNEIHLGRACAIAPPVRVISLRVYRGAGAMWAIHSDPRLYAALTHCVDSSMVNEISLGRVCAIAPPVRVIHPPLRPSSRLLIALSAVPGVEVEAIVEDHWTMSIRVILRRAPADPGPVWRAIADNLPVGILAEGSSGGVVDYESGHSVRVAFSVSGTPPA